MLLMYHIYGIPIIIHLEASTQTIIFICVVEFTTQEKMCDSHNWCCDTFMSDSTYHMEGKLNEKKKCNNLNQRLAKNKKH